MLADLRVLDTGDELLLLCERPALQALFDALRRFKIGFDAELHKRTLERGLLSADRARRRRRWPDRGADRRPSTLSDARPVGGARALLDPHRRRRRRALRQRTTPSA